MTVDIRVLTAEDTARWKHIERVAFMAPADEVSRYIDQRKPEWAMGAFEGGAMQAFVTSVPMVLGLEGSTVPMGGICSVASLPEARRKGLAGELLRETLKRSRDLGQPLSGLWTPHPALYRRYGWDICTDSVRFQFNPKQVGLAPAEVPPGRIERGDASTWKDFNASYRSWALRRGSVLIRDDWWWMTFTQGERELFFYRDPDGRAQGHAILSTTTAGEQRKLTVHELIANTAEAYRALVGLVLGHDLVQEVNFWAATDEPFYEVLADPGPVRRETFFGLFLRIVSLAEAFAGRPAYADGRCVLRVKDETCDWNDGTWEITSVGSRFSAERCDDEPMLTLDARALAQLYNGYRTATDLARAGRIEAHQDRALALADVLFAMRTIPVCLDDF